MIKLLIYTITFCLAIISAKAQKMVYSKQNNSDRTIDDYNIIGNYGGNILVYKRLQSKTIVSVYNAYMNEMSRNDLNIEPDKILKTDFIAYPDYSYMIYQYITQNLVFCMAAKLGADGKMIGKPVQLDYYEVKEQKNKLADIFPYGILSSEDKKQIMVLKASKINGQKYIFKTLLFNENLLLEHGGEAALPMLNNSHFINEFALANDGNLVFINGTKPEVNHQEYFLQEKPALENYFLADTIKLENMLLKSIKLNVDNVNNQYALTSFYNDAQSANIQGIFHYAWDRKNKRQIANITTPLNADLIATASDAKTKSSTLNDFYLQNIILKKDGGFLITAECMYTTTRNTVASPAAEGFVNQLGINYSPIITGGKGFLPQNVLNQTPAPTEPSNFAPQQPINQMNADNIMVLSFDKLGKLQESKMIQKSQFIDQTNGGNMSYALVNTGDGLSFLYNSFEKLNARMPTYETVATNGQASTPKMLDFDKNIIVMPRYAKQTGLHQVVIPCMSHNILLFAKVDF